MASGLWVLIAAGCGAEVVTAAKVWTGSFPYDVAGRALAVAPLYPGEPALVFTGTPNEVKDDGGGPIHGAAYLFGADAPAGPVGAAAQSLFPGTTSQRFGSDVAFPGDVTGDGVPDLAVGGQDERGDGEVTTLVYADPTPGVFPAATAAMRIAGDPYDLEPKYVTSCGDLDGDGRNELCLGATPGLRGTRSGVGVYFGPVPLGEVPFDEVPTFLSADVTDWAGQDALDGGRDLDGDGLADIVIGAAQRGDDTGAAFLVSRPGVGEIPLDGFPRWDGLPGDHGQAGQTVVVGGDLDGDGAEDLVVGAPQGDDRRGHAYVVTDKDGGPLSASHLAVEGDRDHDWMGFDAAIGDLDADGADDLVVGAPRDIYFGFDRPGQVAVFLGPLAAGTVFFADGDRVFAGSNAPDGFGMELEVGDCDGDGRTDLVVGAPYDGSVAVDAGAVYLFTSLFP